MLQKVKQIAEGWKNTIIKDEAVEKIAAERMLVCEECEWNSKNIPDTSLLKRLDVHCTKCGCPLMSKTRCTSCACPINKWEAVTQAEDDEHSKEG